MEENGPCWGAMKGEAAGQGKVRAAAGKGKGAKSLGSLGMIHSL